MQNQELNAGLSRYPRGGAPSRQKAVNRRAKALQGEYEGKLRGMDRQFHGTPEGQHGPLVRRLNSFPKLQGYVIGAFGEVSEDLHRLVDHLTESRGHFLALSSGLATSEREKGQIKGQIRRKLSVALIRANSLCTLSRVSNVGPKAQAAAKRRQLTLSHESAMRQERRSYWNTYVCHSRGARGGIHFFPN